MYLVNLFYINHANTPAWLICLIAVLFSITGSLIGLVIFRKIFPDPLDKANNDFIILSLSTVGLFSSVLISLIVVNTWNFYISVEQIVNKEAHAVEDFYRAAQGMPEPTKSLLLKDVKEYIDVTTKKEWPEMNAGKSVGDDGRLILLNSYSNLLKFKTRDPIISNAHSKAIDQLSKLFDARRDRILSTNAHVPKVIWFVMFFTAFLTVAVSYLYTAESFTMHLISTGFITASLAATLVLIVIFAHPYQGSMRIEPNTFINFEQQNLR